MRTISAVALALWLASCATTAVDTASHGVWHEVRTPRFVAWTDSDAAQAAALLRDLERFHAVALRTTSAQEREGVPPLQILIARDAKTFRAWTGQGPEVAGWFKPTMLGSLAFVSAQAREKDGEISSRHILFHEYTHYLMASSGARVPSWYNEGFAEYLGATEFDEMGAYRLGCPPRYRTQPERALPPLEHILRWGRTEEEQAKARALIEEVKGTLNGKARAR